MKKLCLLALALATAACGTAVDGSVEPSHADPLAGGAAETPLLTDADLDAAQPLTAVASAFGDLGSLDLPIPDLRLIPRRDNQRVGASPMLHEALAEALEPKGRLAYVQRFEFLGFSRTWLRLVTVRDFQFPARLIYRGERPIDSVAVSEDGEIVTFATTSADGDFNVFLLDLEGAISGSAGALFALPGTPYDETDVSMSLDGTVHAWQSFDEATGTTNYQVARLDRATGAVSISNFNITIGGNAIEQTEPSLSGNGREVFFVSDNEVIRDLFGAPIIIRFATDGSSGSVAFSGLPDLTEAFASPSTDFVGERLLFVETVEGADFLETVSPSLGEFAVVLEGAVDHPYLTAEGNAFAVARDGAVFKADINFDDPAATQLVRIPDLPSRAFPSSSPYWARPLPPPPPPPPGTIIYEGSTVGVATTFQRPERTGPELADGDFLYDAFEFTSEGAGLYTFLSEQDYDGYLHLYRAPFDPAAPLANLLAGNDDLGGAGTSGFSLLLDANSDYVLVTSSYAPGDSGTFTNTITPPQIPGPGEAADVQLFTESARVAEPGTTIDYAAFVASTDALVCQIDFGDGTVEDVPCQPNSFATASHAFASEGFYTVTFVAATAGGSDSAQAFPTIAADDPNEFNIVVVFGNDQLSPGQKLAFQGAAERWARAIRGDLPRVDTGDPGLPADLSCSGEPAFNGFIDDVVISAVGEAIDGPGAVLGSAGPCLIRVDDSNAPLVPLPTYGTMRFDIADLDGLEADGSLEDVIVHEMGHVIGIGTLWEANGLTLGTGGQVGDPNYDPRYLGVQGVAQYNVLRQQAGLPDETSVPLANTGGGGTTDSHWREATFNNELMTGFLNDGVNPISILTVGQLEDLGYEVDLVGGSDPYSLPPSSLASLASFAPRGYDIVVPLQPKK